MVADPDQMIFYPRPKTRDLAFGQFGVGRLVAVIHPDHVASRRVAERIGMQPERATVLDEDYPALIYAVEA